MSIWLLVMVILVAVVGAMIWTRMRRSQAQSQSPSLGSEVGVPRDYTQEREDLRSSKLSAEDQAWETASLQRDRDSQAKAPPAE